MSEITHDAHLWSLVDAAAALGVSTRTIRRYVAQGRLQAYRVGPHLIRLDRAQVRALLRPIPAGRSAQPQ